MPNKRERAAARLDSTRHGQPRSDRFGQCAKTGLQPSARSAHPIPRRPINNIPILDTIHLEINRQPIGKPGQIDFEIVNLWSFGYSAPDPSRGDYYYFFPLLRISRRELSRLCADLQ